MIKVLLLLASVIAASSTVAEAYALSLDLSSSSASGQPDDPGGMRFEDVIVDNSPGGVGTLDLIVLATNDFDTYTPSNRANNGLFGDFGQINLRNRTVTSFEFRLVQDGGGIGAIIEPDEFTITFLDLDGVGNPQALPAGAPPEQSQFESVTVATPSTFGAGSALNVNTSISDRAIFSGTFGAGGSNNPSSTTLTEEQSSIAAEITFQDRGIFEFVFGSGTGSGNSGRNVFFTGEAVFFDGEPTHTGEVVPFEPELSLGLLVLGASIGYSRFRAAGARRQLARLESRR